MFDDIYKYLKKTWIKKIQYKANFRFIQTSISHLEYQYWMTVFWINWCFNGPYWKVCFMLHVIHIIHFHQGEDIQWIEIHTDTYTYIIPTHTHTYIHTCWERGGRQSGSRQREREIRTHKEREIFVSAGKCHCDVFDRLQQVTNQ